MADRELRNILNSGELTRSKVGGVNNAIIVREGGQVQRIGEATVWDDLRGNLLAMKLTTTQGAVDLNIDENTVTFQPNGSWGDENDIVGVNIQTPHSMKKNSYLHPHLHFQQILDEAYTFELKYRIQILGVAPVVAWTTIIANAVYPPIVDLGLLYDPATLPVNQILEFGQIQVDGFSTAVQFQLIRSDNIATDLEAYFFDCHYEMDTEGSGREYVKFDTTTTTTTT